MALSGQRPTAISLFTGTGGLDIGLEDAGFEMRCAVEWNNYACSSLRHNKVLATLPMVGFDSWFVKTTGDTYRRWEQERVERVKERVREGVGSHTYFVNSSIVEGDIRTISSEAILDAARTKVGELDLVAGGPPCQSFSRAGKRGSVEDERGQLFLEFVRIVRDARPRWFVFENVKGIILTKTTVWAVICNKCGYRGIPPFDVDRVEPNDADAAPNCTNCGGADTRWRVERNKREGALELILAEFRRIGYYCQYFVLNSVDFGVPQYRERLFIVGSRDNERIVVPSPTFVPGDRSHRSWGIETHPPQRTVWESLFTTPNRDHHWPINPEQAVLWVKNVVRPHDEPVTWSLLRPAPTIGAHQSAKLAVAPFGVPEEQLA
ncbi:MAG: DNA cytosine methyltransferase, partial [Chloroflexi bacterium]|nr:DNA cytosine methyltransferase [Chloroflexota bacterium]